MEEALAYVYRLNAGQTQVAAVGASIHLRRSAVCLEAPALDTLPETFHELQQQSM